MNSFSGNNLATPLGETSLIAVREMLTIARHYNQDLTDLRRRLREAENGKRLTEQGLAVPSGTPWRTNRCPNITVSRERMMEVYDEQIHRIDRRIAYIQSSRILLEELLTHLSEIELRIISLRWLDGKSWRAVSLRVYSCERNCQRIQKRAIEKMAQIFEASGHSVYNSVSTDILISDAQNFSLN